MACGGNPGEMCGAGDILSIYANGTNGTLTSYIEPIIQTTGLPGSWKYQGCLTDADNNRSLPYEIVWEYNNTNVACLEMCQQFGYGAAGTEYGQQCFCKSDGVQSTRTLAYKLQAVTSRMSSMPERRLSTTRNATWFAANTKTAMVATCVEGPLACHTIPGKVQSR